MQMFHDLYDETPIAADRRDVVDVTTIASPHAFQRFGVPQEVLDMASGDTLRACTDLSADLGRVTTLEDVDRQRQMRLGIPDDVRDIPQPRVVRKRNP